jgi:hypothetical protein
VPGASAIALASGPVEAVAPQAQATERAAEPDDTRPPSVEMADSSVSSNVPAADSSASVNEALIPDVQPFHGIGPGHPTPEGSTSGEDAGRDTLSPPPPPDELPDADEGTESRSTGKDEYVFFRTTEEAIGPAHLYQVDALGRPARAAAFIELNPGVRNTKAQAEVRGMGEPGDHAGHLIGVRFGGAGEKWAMVPQAASVNLGGYKRIENALAGKAQEDPVLDVLVVYDGDARRPSHFLIDCGDGGEPITLMNPRSTPPARHRGTP